MAETAFAFFGVLAVLLLFILWRSRSFQRSSEGHERGDEGFPHVGNETQLEIRDPRARLDDGDRLGRR
jgi:hypothetical protein